MRLSLLFLTYNRRGIVARCFQSLISTLDDPGVEWRILDNGSTDGTAEWLLKFAAQYPGQVHVTLRADNTGVAGGRDILFRQARGDVIVSMDSDVEAVRDGWLDRLLAPLDDPQVGLCGIGGNWLTNGWKWYEPTPEGYVGPCDVVSGYCQVFHRSVLNEGVALDLMFSPFWHEDTDFAMQILSLGYQVYCTGDIGLMHIYSGTGDDGTGREKQKYLASKWAGKGLVKFEREAV
jgi:glycosyltransferase involved in cell wall biosynthesis